MRMAYLLNMMLELKSEMGYKKKVGEEEMIGRGRERRKREGKRLR